MTRIMQAAGVEQFGQALVLREWNITSPGPGQILDKSEACGVCHTELHAARGEIPARPERPFIPRHGGVGRAAAVGAGVMSVKQGDRVGVPWAQSACGHCEHCLAGWGTACSGAGYSGYTRHGGFAEIMLADASDVANIAGSRGHLAVQYAKATGLRICVINIDNRKLAHATRLAANGVSNAHDGKSADSGGPADSAAAVRKATDGGGHGVPNTTLSLSAFQQGVRMTRKRGTCVRVGLQPGEFAVPLFDLVSNCITLRGSFVGTRQDMVEALAFAATGPVQADIELQTLSAINHIFDPLERGEVASRVVLDFMNGDAGDRPSSVRWS